MSIISRITLLYFKLFKGKLSDKKIDEQYNANKEAWQLYMDNKGRKNSYDIFDGDYIEGQEKMHKLKYGNAGKLGRKLFFSGDEMTAVDNSCEVIATYNALVHMDALEATTFPDLLKTFSKSGITFSGKFGTSIYAVEKYFKDRGFDVEKLSGRKINAANISALEEKKSTYIVLAFNKKNNLFEMLHTICITKEAKKRFLMHNAYHRESYMYLNDALKGYNKGRGEAIYVIGLGRKKQEKNNLKKFVKSC